MEAGADLEQAADAAAQLDGPRVGSVMRLRIFSSVLLPAPLRPMMPTTSPGCTSKLTSSSAQNASDAGRPGSSPPPCANARARRHPRGRFHDRRAERAVAGLLPGADPIELRQVVDANGGIHECEVAPAAGTGMVTGSAAPATSRGRDNFNVPAPISAT